MRVSLGDCGIVPTAGMEKKLGQIDTPWMADRLGA